MSYVTKEKQETGMSARVAPPIQDRFRAEVDEIRKERDVAKGVAHAAALLAFVRLPRREQVIWVGAVKHLQERRFEKYSEALAKGTEAADEVAEKARKLSAVAEQLEEPQDQEQTVSDTKEASRKSP